ncbi:hypothetical protein MMC30_001483 [Trapelia coarctata]|nr:hypothetical protein [Trapelia coarctata]
MSPGAANSFRRRDTVPASPPEPAPAVPKAKRMENGRIRLLHWDELPEWQQEDNTLIETGYRPATASILECIQSWFYLNNETGKYAHIQVSMKTTLTRGGTVNTFSHLVGAVLFYTLPTLLHTTLSSRYTTSTPGDLAVFALYLFGVAACFSLSVAFHTIASHSKRLFDIGIQLDFQGIVILMWGASAPMVYYTFYTEPKLQKIYWSVESVCAICASIVTFTPAFRKPSTQPLRVLVFGSLAFSGLFTITHGLILHGWEGQSVRFPMWGIGLTLLFNSLGALAYATKFPERWFRRRFDIWGASHQIMHIMIMIAGLAFLAGMLRAFDNVHSGKVVMISATRRSTI